MKLLKKLALAAVIFLVLALISLNIWGYLSLGTLQPAAGAARDPDANRVVMVFGATGSVGNGLLKAAVDDPEVEKIYVVSRRSTPRIDAGVASGKVELLLHQDFTDFSNMADILEEVNTVLWALGTSSLNVDDNTYTLIHVDFPVAFVSAWLDARTAAPMSFHSVTGMGTDPQGSAHWAREKGRAELEVAEMAEGTGLRTFAYHSGFVRPASEQANLGHYTLENLLRPGHLAIGGEELGRAMLEISARTGELANGTIIDNADSIAYAKAYPRGG
ncbi:MAG: hypothetical protein V2I26_00325 [Halieaceae bacterium]|jgi:uncharacterized protein YbjT (DUF2867 family)|nr:hypothetical protein [Halieaceae bacterium]